MKLQIKWSQIHRFIVSQKDLISAAFLMGYVSVIFLVIVAFFTYEYSFKDYGRMMEVGSSLGVFSLICYLTTLAPGIMKRLQVFPLQRASLMLFRRQFGILMFLSAYAHGLIVTTLPLAMSVGLKPEFFTMREQFGMYAVLILFPLWLTSNDLSVRWLGKKWNVLHKLTYLALLLIFIHVLLASELKWAIVGAVVIGLEIWSWVVEYRKNTSVPAPQR